jgi:hypothetical protein
MTDQMEVRKAHRQLGHMAYLFGIVNICIGIKMVLDGKTTEVK